jgi:hypothetical protein
MGLTKLGHTEDWAITSGVLPINFIDFLGCSFKWLPSRHMQQQQFNTDGLKGLFRIQWAFWSSCVFIKIKIKIHLKVGSNFNFNFHSSERLVPWSKSHVGSMKGMSK